MAKVSGDSTTYEVRIEADLGPLRALQDQAKRAGEALKEMGGGAVASGLANMASGLSSAAGVIMSVGRAAFDATTALMGMAAEGAKLNTMEAAFKSLGSSGEDLKKLRELTGGLVSDADLMEAFNLAKLFKLPADEVPKLIKLAQGASAALGTTTAKALQDTFTAASRQSKMIADNMGIVIGDMGKMYEDFAKKRGKSAKDLTDQEKQLAFVQKMISEGGRQMDLATVAQGNSAMKAAASYENLSNNLKKLVADMFGSMGIWETLGGVVGALEAALTSGGGTIKNVFGDALKTLMGIFGTVADALSPLILNLEGLGKWLHIVNGLLKIIAPGVKVLLYAFSELSSFLLDVVSFALENLIRAGAAVVRLFDKDLASTLTNAANEIAKARDVSLELGKSLDGVGTSAQDATPKVDALGVALGVFAGRVAPAAGDAADVFAAKMAMLGGDKVTRESLGKLSAEFDRLFMQAKASGKSAEEAAKFAAEGIAASYSVEAYGFKRAQQIIRDERGKTALASIGAAAKSAAADARGALASVRAVESVDKMRADSVAFGTDMLAASVSEGAKTEADALANLEAYYEQHMEAARVMFAADAAGLEDFESRLSAMTNNAAESLAKAFAKDKGKGDGKGGKAIDWAKRDYDMRLALASDHQRAVMETEARYLSLTQMLRKDDVANRLALAERMNADLLKLEEDRDRARKDAAFEVEAFLMGQSAADQARRIREIRAQAEEMRQVAREQGMDTGAIDVRERELVGEEQAKGGLFAGIGGVMQAQTEMWSAYRENARARQNEAEEEARAHTERMAGLFQNMGTSITDTFVAVAIGGANMREQTFKLMGSLFGQLSTAFLAWATAEGSLLAGNPFAAAGAAIALGLVGSAISAFGSRGKQGGASGGTASMSRSALERKRDDKEKEAQVVIYNYGFATPDQIARSVTRGDMRGRDLEGRRRAS